MEKAKAIENLMRIRNMHNQRVFGAISDEEDEALAMAIEALEAVIKEEADGRTD